MIFFFDGIMNKGDSKGFRFIYAFPPLETIQTDTEKMREAGFDVINAEMINAALRDHVAGLRATLKQRKCRMIDVCGRELYDNWGLVSADFLHALSSSWYYRTGPGVLCR